MQQPRVREDKKCNAALKLDERTVPEKYVFIGAIIKPIIAKPVSLLGKRSIEDTPERGQGAELCLQQGNQLA